MNTIVLDHNVGKARYSTEEWRTRVDLAACYRLIAQYGMSDLIYNHITARIPGTDEHILINPYGMLYEEITASSLVKIDIEGNVLDSPMGFGVNRPGYVIHSAVHKGRPDVNCVIHTHSRAGMAISAMKGGLLPLTQTAMRFKDIAYHDYEGVALDLDERERLVADLGGVTTMVLRNHGLLAVGSSIPQAFNTMYWLEMACKAQVDAMSSTTDLLLPSEDIVEETYRQFQPEVRRPFGELEWPAMLRFLDRRDATYKN
ncbi:class II aldolase [Burkholderia sp. WAC0059]|uniref:class II aldolase/adducin family protein n=1 Tax=Burkholderia sp. WAC0059 TaxID=2066022 RepID=UPI000C7F742C|nr:class II aldolase/adducin family protein [Burkholderia sp. WAC0059]PLY99965.1 class II aldolase [Burkholderia sp. WAC0059]